VCIGVEGTPRRERVFGNPPQHQQSILATVGTFIEVSDLDREPL
jgi:hypothetical protein